MKIITPGYKYELDHFESYGLPGLPVQTLQFIEKEKVGDEFKLVNDGTTNEEVLKVLIDRIHFLQTKNPCPENSECLVKLAEALHVLEKRTKDRQARAVEGTDKP